MKKILVLLSVMLLVTVNTGLAFADTLDFEDADGTNWNASLYGEPVFGPGEAENTYHGFNVEGWRVYNKAGVLATYGASSYLYMGTNGNRSLGRTSFDTRSIANATDFYFNGAQLAALDSSNDQYGVTVVMNGYNDGSWLWTEEVVFWYNGGSAEVKNYLSAYSGIAVDQVSFYAWSAPGVHGAFILDDFEYTFVGSGGTSAVPIPGAIILLGSGLLGLAGIKRKLQA